jgi:HEAT repeat protein
MVLLSGSATALVAQSARRNAAALPPETGEVSRGWALLAQGNAAKASDVARDLLARYPRSIAVLTLAVDAGIAHGGAQAGLGVYGRWVEGKPHEAAYALRRVARAVLVEAARGTDDGAARLQAIEALVADGESALVAGLGGTAPRLSPAEAAALGAAGNEAAITELLGVLEKPMVNKSAAIGALAKTRSPRAVKPLIGLLNDTDPIVRAAAAQGLGTLEARSAVAALKPLLNDPVFTVRFSAAGSLFALKDTSAVAWLRELRSSEHAAIRLAALRAMRTDPDPGWVDEVRALTTDADAEVRRQAAELIAPHDPDTARATLEPMLKDSNPAQREAAGASYVQAASDFASLRRLLESPEGGMRVRAAARILELTR